MGEIVTDSTIQNGSSESITGYRSGSYTDSTEVPKNTCDIRVTATDPFDFTIDWRTRTVRTRKARALRSGKIRYYYTYVRIPYPYYQFVSKTRTVKAWRLELKAGAHVLGEIPKHMSTPHIKRLYDKLVARLKKFGPCRPVNPRSPSIQHETFHWSTSIVGFKPYGLLLTPGGFNRGLASNNQMYYRCVELDHETYDGNHQILSDLDDDFYNRSGIIDSSCISGPNSCVFSSSTISTLTAMLWPDSGDFEDVGVTPLVDIAEAASDGAFPLGPPPSPADAHSRMVKGVLDDKLLSSMREVVDFASNSWLWTTLVLEPVIQSAIGLAASVKANDLAIEKFTDSAKSGKWIQGKSLRIFGKDPSTTAELFGAPNELSYDNSYSLMELKITSEFEYKKMAANASFNYKLSEVDALLMNTSSMRISSFFNRMAVSLDTVLHNIIPLSFVYDWFSSEYTGALNLKDKVYMPVADWNLVVSYNLKLGLETRFQSNPKSTSYDRYICRLVGVRDPIKWWLPPTLVPKCTFDRVMTYEGYHPDKPDYWLSSTTYYKFSNRVQFITEHEESSTETHDYYKRKVYTRPSRREDFSGGIGISCLDTVKYDPLDTGKSITLGALLWGIST